MSIEDFKGLMDAFEPASLLPELEPILGKLAALVRIAVLIGPAMLVIMGLLYLFAAPKEANYHFGYRCYFGMGSVEAWRFTQSLAGIVWTGLGLILGIVMLLISGKFAGMQTMDLLWRGVSCVALEAGLTAAACLLVNSIVAIQFNGKGEFRRKKHTRT